MPRPRLEAHPSLRGTRQLVGIRTERRASEALRLEAARARPPCRQRGARVQPGCFYFGLRGGCSSEAHHDSRASTVPIPHWPYCPIVCRLSPRACVDFLSRLSRIQQHHLFVRSCFCWPAVPSFSGGRDVCDLLWTCSANAEHRKARKRRVDELINMAIAAGAPPVELRKLGEGARRFSRPDAERFYAIQRRFLPGGVPYTFEELVDFLRGGKNGTSILPHD